MHLNIFEIITHSFDESLSTANNLKMKSYENVKTLTVDVTCEKINQTLIAENIMDLNLKFSGAPVDWIFSMTRLCKLSLGHQLDISPEDFIRLVKKYS